MRSYWPGLRFVFSSHEFYLNTAVLCRLISIINDFGVISSSEWNIQRAISSMMTSKKYDDVNKTCFSYIFFPFSILSEALITVVFNNMKSLQSTERSFEHATHIHIKWLDVKFERDVNTSLFLPYKPLTVHQQYKNTKHHLIRKWSVYSFDASKSPSNFNVISKECGTKRNKHLWYSRWCV